MFEIALRVWFSFGVERGIHELARGQARWEAAHIARKGRYVSSIIVKSSLRSPQLRYTPLKTIDEIFKSCHLGAGTMKEFV